MPKIKKDHGGNAVVYARYSSHNQRDVSIEQQYAACEAFAVRNGFTIVERYADRAISGRTDNRPAFQKMLRDSHKGGFDYVIAWKSNRMGRNMMQAMINESKLAENGVRCLYVEEDFEDNAAGRFSLRTMMNVNQFYSENMAEDVRRGMEDNAAKCMVNNLPPYGYRKGADGRYELDPERAPIVREIFDRISCGWSICDIQSDLNRRGIRTSRGTEWKKQSFGRILQNDKYTGIYRWADVEVVGGMPAIVDRQLFDRVQLILKSKKKPRGKQRMNDEYLLTGKLFCGHCGSPMTAQTGTSKTGKKFSYYACNRKRYDHACDKKNVPRDVIEQQVLEYIEAKLHDAGFIDFVCGGYAHVVAELEADSERRHLDAELKDVNTRIRNMLQAIEMGVVNEATQERMQELLAARRDLEEAIRLDEARNDVPSVDEVRFWLEGLRDGDFRSRSHQRKVISTFVQAIYVYDDHLVIRFNYGKEISLKSDKAHFKVNTPPEDPGGRCSREVRNGAPIHRLCFAACVFFCPEAPLEIAGKPSEKPAGPA